MSRIEQLVSSYLEGELGPEEANELAGLLAKDSALRKDFIEIYRQHLLLRECHGANLNDGDDFAEHILAELRGERCSASRGVFSKRRPNSGATTFNAIASKLNEFLLGCFSGVKPLWGFSIGVSAVLAMVLAVAFYLFRANPLSAEMSATTGEVAVIRGHRNIPGYDGFELKNGDVIQTSSNATVVVRYLGERTLVSLKSCTQLAVRNSRHGKRLNLKTGEISVVADHQPAHAPLIITTGQAEARVVGTRFRLAAGNLSTWLEVTEGSVALKKTINQRENQKISNLMEREVNQVVVRAGEYSVVAEGLPLQLYKTTDGMVLGGALPIPVGWFAVYAAPNWIIHPPEIRHTQPSSMSRTFYLPPVKGNLLVAGSVLVNAVKNGSGKLDRTVGFGIGLSGGANYFLACVKQRFGTPYLELAYLNNVPLYEGQPVGNIAESNVVSLAEMPLPRTAWPSSRIKFAMERANDGEAILRAKAWFGSDAEEPKAWQISAPVNLHAPETDFQLRLATFNAACTFENTSVFLFK